MLDVDRVHINSGATHKCGRPRGCIQVYMCIVKIEKIKVRKREYSVSKWLYITNYMLVILVE